MSTISTVLASRFRPWIMPKHILGIGGTLATGILFISSRKPKWFSSINHSSGFDPSKDRAMLNSRQALVLGEHHLGIAIRTRLGTCPGGRHAQPLQSFPSVHWSVAANNRSERGHLPFTFVGNESLQGSCTFDCTLALIQGLAIPMS